MNLANVAEAFYLFVWWCATGFIAGMVITVGERFTTSTIRRFVGSRYGHLLVHASVALLTGYIVGEPSYSLLYIAISATEALITKPMCFMLIKKGWSSAKAVLLEFILNIGILCILISYVF